MIEQTEFRTQREEIRNKIFPHKTVRLDELKQLEENLYSINDFEVEVAPRAREKLDRLIVTSPKQLNIVRNFSGEAGQANFRNYLTTAQGFANEKEIVLIADSEERIITNVVIPQIDFISVDEFFDFAELFIDETDSQVEKIQTSYLGEMNIRIYMQKRIPNITSFAFNEDFITNGTFLHWNGESVRLGNYYTRLICQNGQSREINQKLSTIYSLAPNEIEKMLKFARSEELLSTGFNHFKDRAHVAMTTQSSLRELANVHKKLQSQTIGLPSELADILVPYQENVEYFRLRKIDVNKMSSIIKTNIRIWELYNNMTTFASHTDFFDKSDLRRTMITNLAMSLLNKKYDIQNYIEYA